MKSVLVVCIGNICRSPMAEAILRHRLPELNVKSAGIGALIGHPADPMANKLLSERGIDLSSHIAQPLNLSLCQWADIILVMDQEQRRFIEQKYLSTRGKVFRIAEDVREDVPDPYRKDINAFKQALYLIDNGASVWIERIKKLTEKERKFK